MTELDEPTRDRFGESVFRFFLSTRERTRLVLGDPHPGNYLLLDDGRVGFLDFGLLRRVSPTISSWSGRWGGRSPSAGQTMSTHLMSTLGYLPEPEEFDPEALLDQVSTGAAWLFEPGFRRLDPAYAHELIEQGGSPRSPHYEAMKRQTLPAASLLMRRQEALILVVLAQLRAGADWTAISREYVFGEPPTSDLGRAEAEFWGD